MRFQQQFEAAQYTPWKQWYLPYDNLKVLIKISFPSPGELRRSTNRRHIGSDDISSLVAHRRLARQQRQESHGVALARRTHPLRTSHSDPNSVRPSLNRLESIENIPTPMRNIATTTTTHSITTTTYNKIKPSHITLPQNIPTPITPVTQHIAVTPTTSLLLGPRQTYGTHETSTCPVRHVTIDPIPIHIDEHVSTSPVMNGHHKDDMKHDINDTQHDKHDTLQQHDKHDKFIRTDTPHPNGHINGYEHDDDDDTENMGVTVPDKIQNFLHALRKELLRIDPFYRRIESELMASLHALHQQMFHIRSDGMGHDAIR